MLLEEVQKIFEVSEFSILTYTQNRKLRNLRECYFTSNFDSGCNLRCKNEKNKLRQRLIGQAMLLEEKKKNFRGFRVFDFVLYPKLKTRKSRKFSFSLLEAQLDRLVFVSVNFLSFCISESKTCSFTSSFDSSCN